MSDNEHPHHQGLAGDLTALHALRSRRSMLRFMAGLSMAPAIACLGGGTSSDGSSSEGSSADGGSTGSVTSCSKIPEETAGPYPGDGSNGPNALTLSGIVRSDIRSSFAGSSGTAAGIPLTVKLTLVNASGSCEPLQGYAIYLWQCDRDGKYSLYSAGVTNQNYLRGVQETSASGEVTFTTIFPGCYDGRWPHIHFEIYPALSVATSSQSKVATSQLAMLKASCDQVYTSSGYSASASNLARASLSTDMVFRDGATLQLPTMTGSVTDGFVASLVVGIQP